MSETAAQPVFRHRAKDESEEHTKCVACGYWWPCPEYVLHFGGESGQAPESETPEGRVCGDLDHSAFIETIGDADSPNRPSMFCWQCTAPFVPNKFLNHRRFWSTAGKEYRCIACGVDWPCEPVVHQDLVEDWEAEQKNKGTGNTQLNVNHPHPTGPVWVLLGWDENALPDDPALFIAEYTTDPVEADMLLGEAETGEFWLTELAVEAIGDEGFDEEE